MKAGDLRIGNVLVNKKFYIRKKSKDIYLKAQNKNAAWQTAF
jgi:hypothetical protein